jgi:hypothetical protein
MREGEFLREFLLAMNPTGAVSTLVLRRAVLEQVGLFNEDLERHEDIHYLVKFFRHFKLAFVDEILVKIHGHNRPPGSVAERSKLRLFQLIREDISRLSKGDAKHYYAFQYRELSTVFALDGHIRQSIKYLKKSLCNRLLFPTRYVKMVLAMLDTIFQSRLVSSWDRLTGKIETKRRLLPFLKRVI